VALLGLGEKRAKLILLQKGVREVMECFFGDMDLKTENMRI